MKFTFLKAGLTIWSFRQPRQLYWRWEAECPQCRRGTSTALTETHNGQLPALLSGTSFVFKGELNQSHKSDWEHQKCADISTCMFHFVAQLVFIKIKTLYQWKTIKVCWWRFCHFCHTSWPCSWRHWDRLLGAEWQHSQSCFSNFPTSIFNIQDEKSSENLLCLFFIVPFLSIRPVLLLWFSSILTTVMSLLSHGSTYMHLHSEKWQRKKDEHVY